MDFWNGGLLKLFFVRPQSKQSETFSGCYSTGSTCPLVCRCLADGYDYKTVHASSGVVSCLFNEATVDDVHDVVNGKGGFCDVGGKDDFATALWSGFKDFGLHIAWEAGVNGQDQELLDFRAESFHTVVDLFHGFLNFVLSSEKTQNITISLRQMDLQHSHNSGFDVIGLGVGSVVNVDRESSSRDFNDWGTIEILGKLFGLQSG